MLKSADVKMHFHDLSGDIQSGTLFMVPAPVSSGGEHGPGQEGPETALTIRIELMTGFPPL